MKGNEEGLEKQNSLSEVRTNSYSSCRPRTIKMNESKVYPNVTLQQELLSGFFVDGKGP